MRSSAEAWLNRTAPHDLERNAIEVKKCAEQGYVRNLEIDYINRSEQITPIEINATVVGSGESVRILSLCRDITERKQAEEALSKERNLVRALMDNVPDNIYFKDTDSRFITISKALAEKFNLSERAQSVGKTDFDFFTEDHARPAFEDEQKIIKTGEPLINLEEKETWPDGRTTWVSTTKVPLRDAQGQIIGTFGISRDITEHKLAEASREQERVLLKTLIDHLPNSVFVKDKEYKKTVVNTAHLKRVGVTLGRKEPLTEADLLGKTDFEVYPKELAEEYFAEDQRIIRDGETILGRQQCSVDSNGRQRWELISKIPLRDKERSLLGMVGIALDITERIQAEEKLKESETRYRLISNVVSDYVFSTNVKADGGLIAEWVAGAFEAMTGYTFEEYASIGGWRAIVHPDDYAIDDHDMEKLRSNQQVVTELRTIMKSGKVVWVRVYAHPVWDEKRNILAGIYGAVQNISEQKRVETELRTRETQLATASKIARMGYWEYDVDKDLFLFNDHFYNIFRTTAEQVGGYTMSSAQYAQRFVHPDDLSVVGTEIQKALETTDPNFSRDIEHRIIFADGSIGYISVRIFVIKDDKGRTIRTYGVNQDITVRKQAEEALRESEERFRSLYENSTVGIYRTTPDGKILLANPALINMLGYSSLEEFAAKDLQREGLDHSYDRSRFLKSVESRGEVKGLESCWVKRDGTRVFIRENSHVIRDSQGKTLYYDGIVEDITEQKRTEESLMRLNQAVAASSEVIFMTDRSGIITFANAAFAQLYGHEPNEVIGKATPRILKSGVQQREKYTAFWHTLLNRQIVKEEWINRTKDGRLLNIEITANPILDSQGKIVGFLCIQRDVTEQRNLEKEMHQAQKLESLGTLASGIAHDFNNILGIIMGHSSIISISHSDPQRLKASIAAIDKASERGASLVRQMLTFARKGDVEFTPIQVNDSVKEIEKLYHETFPKTMTLSCRLTDGLPLITADSTQLHQVLLNLCVNARDAMSGTGTLTISTGIISGESLRSRFIDATFEQYVSVKVDDTGVGMDEATIQRIFDPFFTTKEVGKGTGLGLAVVFGIVESHEGFIDVQSKIGQGTTFSLYFPVKKLLSAKSIDHEKEVKKGVPGGTETILVVEDEELLRELIHISLEGNGYTVLTASNGEEAIEVYKQNQQKIALVLSDLGLPILSGREILKKLRAHNPAIKFIMATGYTDPGERSEIFRDGAKEIVQKPYNMNDLLNKIRDVLDA